MFFKPALLSVTFALTFGSQTVSVPKNDQQKIADALKGGPSYITDGASIRDYPTSPNGPWRQLRKGRTFWTCLPTSAGSPHQRPACVDPTFLKFFQDALAHRPVHVDRVGIEYMYSGDWVSPHGVGGPKHLYEVGSHIMIIVPNGAGLENYTTDGSHGRTYINRVPGTSMPYLVIPIHVGNGLDTMPMPNR